MEADEATKKHQRNIAAFSAFIEKNICKDSLENEAFQYNDRIKEFKENLTKYSKKLADLESDYGKQEANYSKTYHELLLTNVKNKRIQRDLYN